jgi:hypothetical protein
MQRPLIRRCLLLRSSYRQKNNPHVKHRHG